MTRIEKIELAIKKGFTYDELTGKVYSRLGKEITSTFPNGYKVISMVEDGVSYILYQHQFGYYIKYNTTVECLDHINGDKTDNRIKNIRSVTRKQNAMNTRAKGYSFNKTNNKFVARIIVDGKYINLGYFNNEGDARVAYLTAKKILHKIY